MRHSVILLKRAYDAPSRTDGARILVDRLWPRGITKTALKLDLWAKEAAPSNELRKWYHADLTQFAEFRRRYLAELKNKNEALDQLRSFVAEGPATLLTASKNLEHSHAAVLRELLMRG